MESYSSDSINCCFCDKDLSPGDNKTKNSIIKYKCPGCERFYCSAICSSGHKEKFACSGTRNKTPYVHLSKFDQKQFLDDYFFLEEVNNKIENAQRCLNQLKPHRKTNINNKSKRRNHRVKSNKK